MATVLVPLAQGMEELEAVTIIDLLRHAGIEVVTAGLDANPVKGSRGTVVIPDTTLDFALECQYDMIVLPGGLPGATNLEADSRIISLVKKNGRREPVHRRHLFSAQGSGPRRCAGGQTGDILARRAGSGAMAASTSGESRRGH
jgi:hypothetical protein